MDTQIEPVEHRIVLDELRRNLDKSYEASAALDTKLQQLLGFTSLIVTISGMLQLSAMRQIGGWLFVVVLIIALVLYALIFFATFKALKPVTRDWVITGDWSALHELYFNSGETKVLERLSFDYLEAIKQNDAVNMKKAESVQCVMVMIFLLVIVILCAMPISLAAAPFTSPIASP
jgi:hypothetical protein